MAHNDQITSAKFCFSQRVVLTASLDCTIKFWDTFTGETKGGINTYSKVFDMHISRSETHIVSGHNDGSIKVWNAKTKDRLFLL